MARISAIVIAQLYGGVLNDVTVFSNDAEGKAEAEVFVESLRDEHVDDADYLEEVNWNIKETGCFTFGDYDVLWNTQL